MKKTVICFLTGLLFLMFIGCAGTSSEAPELLEPVRGKRDTGTVMRGDLEKTDAVYGTMVPKATQVYISVSGTIKEFTVWSGKRVEAGETLLVMDGEQVEERIEEIEKSLEDLQKQGEFADRLSDLDILKKTRELTHLQGIGADSRTQSMKDTELQAARLQKTQNQETRQVREAAMNHELEKLREDLQGLVLTAPCSGYVYIDETLRNGMAVMEGREVMKILDEQDLVFRTDTMISEALLNEYYGWINGERYELEFQPMDMQKLMGLITAGESLYSDFAVKDGEKLSEGMRGMVILISRRLTDVLYVPTNALSRDTGGSYLMIETADGQEKRYVTIGISSDVNTEIRSGVSEGEVFYVQN